MPRRLATRFIRGRGGGGGALDDSAGGLVRGQITLAPWPADRLHVPTHGRWPPAAPLSAAPPRPVIRSALRFPHARPRRRAPGGRRGWVPGPRSSQANCPRQKKLPQPLHAPGTPRDTTRDPENEFLSFLRFGARATRQSFPASLDPEYLAAQGSPPPQKKLLGRLASEYPAAQE